MEHLEGIAAADAHLGRKVPLPAAPLPLARWLAVVALGPGAVEIEWSLDDTRTGSPGRLALYAGTVPPPDRGWGGEPALVEVARARAEHRQLALADAQPSLRPAQELRWEAHGLHLRLTAQGAWPLERLLEIAASVAP